MLTDRDSDVESAVFPAPHELAAGSLERSAGAEFDVLLSKSGLETNRIYSGSALPSDPVLRERRSSLMRIRLPLVPTFLCL